LNSSGQSSSSSSKPIDGTSEAVKNGGLFFGVSFLLLDFLSDTGVLELVTLFDALPEDFFF